MKPMKPMDPDSGLQPHAQMAFARSQKKQPIVGMGSTTPFPKIAKQHMQYVSMAMAKQYPDLV